MAIDRSVMEAKLNEAASYLRTKAGEMAQGNRDTCLTRVKEKLSELKGDFEQYRKDLDQA